MVNGEIAIWTKGKNRLRRIAVIRGCLRNLNVGVLYRWRTAAPNRVASNAYSRGVKGLCVSHNPMNRPERRARDAAGVGPMIPAAIAQGTAAKIITAIAVGSRGIPGGGSASPIGSRIPMNRLVKGILKNNRKNNTH
jgi:hypothetical protein